MHAQKTAGRQGLYMYFSTATASACSAGDGAGQIRSARKDLAVSYGDVAQAAYRIRAGVQRTPCETNTRCSELVGCEVLFKDDFRQFTGSFKERRVCSSTLKITCAPFAFPSPLQLITSYITD